MATRTASFTTVGAHSLTAVYAGNTNNLTSTSDVNIETIGSRASSTSLASSVNPATVGQNTTLTATITGTTPSGSVAFMDRATTIGTASVSAGRATLVTNFASTGSHGLMAVYAGDANNATSSSAVLTETVNPRATTTTLTTSATPTSVGQGVTLTATVTGSGVTGTVTFKDGTTTIGTGTVSAGVATLATSFATKATHRLTAVYGGDANNATSTSAAINEVVNAAATTTVLTSSANPAAVADVVTLTATVTGSNATGTVTFKDGATTLGTATLAGGVATRTASFTTVGAHSLTAIYAGDANNLTSTSTSFTETIGAGGSTTTLTSSINPSAVGQSTTLAAVVTGNSPSGSVTFMDGATSLGAAPLAAGRATLSVSFSASGARSLTAVYAGDSNNGASTSAVMTQTVVSTVPALVFVASPNPVGAGQATVLSVTVTGSNPTGTVTFTDGATTLGTSALSAGVATLSTSFSTTGAHGLSAAYGGDAANASASRGLSVTVTAASSTTTLVAAPNPSLVGASVNLTATVGGVAPTGSVTFKDGATTLGTVALSGGTATLSTPFAASGTRSLSAVYGGDANNAASTSAAVSQVVNATASSLVFTATPASPAVGQATVLSVTVTGSNPTGTVTFTDGATTLGASALSAGVATLSTTFVTSGPHGLNAAYGGDTANLPSSRALSVPVGLAGASVALTAAPSPSAVGQIVTMSATVSGASPTGTVTFKDGAATLGSAALISGTASFAATFSAAGAHSLTATYGGDANNQVATSASFSQVVTAVATTMTLIASPNPATLNQPTLLTATVSGSSPSGTITFSDGAVNLGTGTLNAGGVATLTASFAVAGAHSIGAAYGGDSGNAAATQALSLSVGAMATTSAMSASPNPSVAGQSVVLTGTVTGANPTGAVTFKDGATTIGTAALAGGNATATVSFASTGAHALTASYPGDSNNAASASAVVTQTVNATATTTQLTTSAATVNVGQGATLTATVTGASPTGSVSFKDGSTVLGSGPLSGGQATFVATFASAGSHTLTAVYAGDSNNGASTSAVMTQTVVSTVPALVFVASPNPVGAGQATVLSVTVTGSNPTGTVTFTDGATTLGTSALSAGVATLSTSFSTTGAHGLSAAYGGDAANASASRGLSVTVTAASSTTTLVAAPNPSLVGASVNLTATVGGVAPTGSVTFKDGATTLGTVALSGGTATLSTPFAASGTRSLSAVYGGDANNAASTSAAVSQVVNATASSLVFTATPASPAVGQATVLSVTVTGSNPTGTVTFTDGATTLGTSTLSAGVATLSTSFSTTGAHALSAAYGGDAANASASRGLSVTVIGANSTTTLVASPNPSLVGANVTLTATVTGAAPTGSVSFKDGSAILGTATLSAGQATFVATFASAGSHTLTAVYAGDGNNASSTSSAVVEAVNGGSTSVTLTATPNPSGAGWGVTMVATVAGSSPTGTVEFRDNGVAITSIPVVAGRATLVWGFATGTHPLSAFYRGDANNPAATSATVNEVVQLNATSMALTASPQSVQPNQVVTITATASGYLPTGTNSVYVTDGGTYIGGGPVNASGVFTFTTTFPVAGNHPLVAVFTANAANASSTSATVIESVGTTATTTNLSVSPIVITAGQTVTLTATVAGSTPLGVVTFSDGGVAVTGAAVSGGTAVATYTIYMGGAHNFTASYGGDSRNAPSTSTPASVFVNFIPSTTTLTSSLNPAAAGQSVILQADLSPSGSGTVTFKDGATVIGTAASYGPAAQLTTSFATAGSHSLTATYGGNSSTNPSTSAPITQTVSRARTDATVSSSPSSLPVGQQATLTATLTGANPTGSVIFLVDLVPLGSAPLSGGTATFVATFNIGGPHVVTVSYPGDSNNLPLPNIYLPITVTVAPAASTTTLTTSLNPTTTQQPLVLTAVVTGANPTGTVTFKDGASTLGTGTLSGGVATYSTGYLTAGSHSLTASYPGDASNLASASIAFVESVTAGGTTLSASPSRVNVGARVDLLAIVPSSATGRVTFKDGATTLGSVDLTYPSNWAQLTTSFTAPGVHNLSAAYLGDANFPPSTSAVLPVVVNGVAISSTSLTSSTRAIEPNQNVTFTAVVTGANPSGTVTFKANGALLGTSSLVSGVGTLTTYFPNYGLRVVTAEYGGDAGNAASVSPALQQAVGGNTATSVVMTSNQNPAYISNPVQLSAIVSGGNPTGNVEFWDGDTLLGVSPLGLYDPGYVYFTATFTSRAVHNLKAIYQGDNNYSSSASPILVQGLSLPTTSVSLHLQGAGPDLTVVGPGGIVNLAARLGGGSYNHFGNVTYFDGATAIGTDAFSIGGSSFLTATLNGLGNHTLSAVVAANDYEGGSTSNAIVVTVTQALLTSSLNPARVGQSIVLSATIGGANPTGVVTFMDGATVLGTAPLLAGAATWTTSFSVIGSHNLKATYVGDANNPATVTPTVVEVINNGPVTTITTTSNPVYTKRAISITATLSSGNNPTGTVTFMDGATRLGAATVGSGTAEFPITFTAPGLHSLTALYSGDTNNAATVSPVFAQTVLSSPSVTTLLTGPNPATVGQTVTLSALIAGSDDVFGKVTFMDGSKVLGQAFAKPILAGAGNAEITTTFTEPGIHTLTAVYSGDHATSVSNSVFEQVGTIATAPPGPMTWQYSIDAQGGLASVTDGNGNQTANSYDNLRRLRSSAQSGPDGALGPIVGMAYDGQGRPTAVVDPRSLVTTYTVDGLGNVVGLRSPDMGTSSATFDPAGNVLTETDARGKTKTYTYDALNRVKSISYTTGVPTMFEYDGGASPIPASKGKLTRVTDESGSTIFTYDGLGNLASKTQQIGSKVFTVSYTWGANGTSTGKLVSITYPSGNRANYQYDSTGRVSGITLNPVNINGIGTNTGAALNILSAITYNGENNLLGWTWANNAPYQRTFDAFGRLWSYPLGYSAGTGLAAGVIRTISYDNAGRISGFVHTNTSGAQPAFNQGFAYDTFDRLTGQGTSSVNNRYDYDVNGNRTGLTVGATTYSNTVAPDSNRFLQVQSAGSNGIQTSAYAYDASGNVISDELATYVYGDRGRMTQATIGGVSTSYIYNGLEQRVSKLGSLVPTGASYLVLDEAGQILGEYDASGKPVTEMIYFGTTPISVLKQAGQASNATLSVLVGNVYADQTDTPRVVTQNIDEAVLWRWDSGEAFGTSSPSENPSGLGTYKLNLRFPGQIIDAETSTFYNGHRNYGPRTGRYMQSDPIGLGGGFNTYAYARSRPNALVDRTGLLVPEAIVAGVIGAVYNVGAGLISGDRGNKLWVDAAAGFGTGFVIGLTDGASLLAASARAGFSVAVDADRQLINSGGSDVNWWSASAAGIGSVAADWLGQAIARASLLGAMDASRMTEQAAGGWLGGLVGGYGGVIGDSSREHSDSLREHSDDVCRAPGALR